MLKADIHIHTRFSDDSLLSLEKLIETCQKRGINCVAITDHDTIEGAFKVRELAPFKVIIGEEIRTLDGEISGLFLKERIPPDLPAEETIKRIREQEGLVYIPHPFSVFRRESLSRKKLYGLYKEVDIIEGYNTKNFLFFENRRAIKFARENGIVMGGGSDAHHQSEIGNAIIEMEDFNTKEEFLDSLKEGKIRLAPYSRRIGSFMIDAFFYLSWLKVKNFFDGKRT